MSASFLAQAVANLKIAVEVAWGADLTDLDGSGWTWTDITADVLLGDEDDRKISITIGRPDESQDTQASEFTCVLDNRSGAYSLGGQASNWPNVKRGTPVRCRISTNNGSSWTTKYQGQAVSWQPSWDEVGRFATVLLTASGPLRKLNQGTLPTTSAYKRWIQDGNLANVTSYYPIEDGPNSDLIASGVSGVAAGTVATNSRFKFAAALGQNGDIFPSSAPLANGSRVDLHCPSNGTFCMTFFMAMPAGGLNIPDDVDYTGVVFIPTSSGTIRTWVLTYANFPGSGGGLSLRGFTSVYNGSHPTIAASVGLPNTTSVYNANANGRALLVQVAITPAGGSSNVQLNWWPFDPSEAPDTNTGSLGSSTGQVTDFQLNSVAHGATQNYGNYVSGHAVVTSNIPSLASTAWQDAALGHLGEGLTDRLARVGSEYGINVDLLTSAAAETSTSLADSMGPQYYDTLTNHLREAEATGQGVLFDGLGVGLTYVTRQRRMAQQPFMTLDASAGQLALAFEPVDDDQQTVNQMSVTSRRSSSADYTDLSGPLGANAIGLYSSSKTVNPEADDELDYTAQWLVHAGTIQGYRYPQISFALEWQPSKVASWLAAHPGARFDITNIDTLRTQHPAGTLRNILEGWTETIDAFTWRVTANCSNWQAWNVGTMAASTGTTVDTVMRRDTDGSAVNTAAAAGATSLSVKRTNASYPLWTTAADDFPMTVQVAGMPVTITAISGASSPQTFTIASPGLPQAVSVDEPVSLWNPPVLGM